MMRILHVNAGNIYGGIETLLATLAAERALCPDVSPEFALFYEGRLSDELRAAGVPVHLLGEARISRPWTVLRSRGRLAELLHQQPFDAAVTHGCWLHALAAPTIRRAQLPLVFWMHGFQTGRNWLERWAGWTPPDLVLANSLATQATADRLFPKTLCQLLYLPVSAPKGLDRAAIRSQVRGELSCPEDAPVIVMAGRMEAWKGHAALLEALHQMKDIPSWHCWVAGGSQRPAEDRYLDELRQSVVNFGLECRVRFLGQRGDIPRLFAGADIYCQPNTGAEPFGISFIEALYAGLCIVTTALGGPREIVQGDHGLLVPPGDCKQLAATLSSLIKDGTRRQWYRERGPARAAALCDPRAQLAKLRDSLQAVC